MKGVMQRIVSETKVLYENSMQKSQCEFSFIVLKIRKLKMFSYL